MSFGPVPGRSALPGAPPARKISHRLVLVLFCAAIWLPGLPARTLWPADESRYALIALQMVDRGDYVVPIKRGDVYHSQPPLFLWLEALAASISGGRSEAALRVPSFLAGVGGVLIVHAAGCAWFGPGAGLLAGLVLATDIRYLVQAQWISTDMLLCLLVTGTLASFAHGYRSGRRGWYLASYALASAATMTKGPVGFVLPGVVILAFLAARRDLGEVLRMKLPAGVLIFAAIVLPWYASFWQRAGADEAVNLVLTQSFRRYVAAWNNQQPWHYFLWRLPLDMLPWTALLPFAVWLSLKRMPARERLFLLCWMASMLLFFSLSTGKRGVYLLPLHPAAALLIGWAWDAGPRAPPAARTARAMRASAFALATVFIGASAAFLLRPAPLAGIPGALQAAAALGGIGLAARVLIALSPPRLAVRATAAATGSLAVAALFIAAPLQNQRLDPRRFASEVARLGAPARPRASSRA